MSERSTLPNRENYSIGRTVSAALNVKSSPFTEDSMDKFVARYKNEILKSNPDNDGDFKFECRLAQTSEDKLLALGISGELSLTYGPISGDASLNFGMNNNQSSMELTLFIRGEHAGKIYRNDDFNKLALSDTAAKYLKEKQWDEFSKKYGNYLIIGEVKGGSITHESIYSTSSKGDTMTAGGHLSIAYGEMGFDVKGKVEGNFENKNLSSSTSMTTRSSLDPSFVDKRFDNLIDTLSELAKANVNDLNKTQETTEPEETKKTTETSKPEQTDQNNQNDENNNNNENNKKEETKDNNDEIDDIDKIDDKQKIRGIIHRQMQNLLSDDRIDTISVVVVPLDTVTSISNAIVDNEPSKSLKTFLSYSNSLYMKLVSISDDLTKISTSWKLTDEDQDVKSNIILYTRNCEKLKELMGYESVEEDQLSDLVTKRKNYLDQEETKENEEKQINKKTWYHIEVKQLELEFDKDVLTPYNEHVGVGSKDLFKGRWAIKSLTSKAYLDGRKRDAVVTYGNPRNDDFLLWRFETIGENGSIAIKNSTNGYLDGRTKLDESAYISKDMDPYAHNVLQWQYQEVNENYAFKSVSSQGYLDGKDKVGEKILVVEGKPEENERLVWELEGPY